MAIKIMRRATIICDECGKYLAAMRSTREVINQCDADFKYTEVICAACRPEEKDTAEKATDVGNEKGGVI